MSLTKLSGLTTTCHKCYPICQTYKGLLKPLRAYVCTFIREISGFNLAHKRRMTGSKTQVYSKLSCYFNHSIRCIFVSNIRFQGIEYLFKATIPLANNLHLKRRPHIVRSFEKSLINNMTFCQNI